MTSGLERLLQIKLKNKIDIHINVFSPQAYTFFFLFWKINEISSSSPFSNKIFNSASHSSLSLKTNDPSKWKLRAVSLWTRITLLTLYYFRCNILDPRAWTLLENTLLYWTKAAIVFLANLLILRVRFT